MSAPWTKLTEEPIRVGFRKILKRTFRLPDGPEHVFHVKDEGVAVCILAVSDEGNFILAEQFRPGPERVLRELPGGGVEDGESLEEAAKRELLEETGYAGEMHYIGKHYRCAYSNGETCIFLATNCKKVGDQALDSAERVRIVEISVDEFLRQLRKGELTDAGGAWMALDYLDVR